MDPIKQFQQRFDEATDLTRRMQVVYPARRNDMAELRARWEKDDPNVVKYCYGPDEPDRYKLEFTKSQRDELKTGYLDNRQSGNGRFSQDDMDSEATVFVRTIEAWAGAENYFEASVPDEQKARKNTLKSVKVAVEKLDQALNELDSEAMGYLYAHLVDGLAVSGVQLSADDNKMTSMLNEHLRAVVEGGEMRKTIRALASTIVDATNKASNSLPKYDHVANDPRLRMAKQMERFMFEHQLPFEARDSGFAVQCLRAMFELAGIDVEKPGYWIKKAIDDPDSHARWIERMQGHLGEN